MDPFCYFFFKFVFIVTCTLVSRCCERVDFLAVLCVMFPYDFVTFPYGVSDQVWYFIVSFLDLCLLHYFKAASLLPVIKK